jgi:serine/threonine protein kinase
MDSMSAAKPVTSQASPPPLSQGSGGDSIAETGARIVDVALQGLERIKRKEVLLARLRGLTLEIPQAVVNIRVPIEDSEEGAPLSDLQRSIYPAVRSEPYASALVRILAERGIEVKERLGAGNSATVFRCVERGLPYALKLYRMDRPQLGHKLRGDGVLVGCRHPALLRVHAAWHVGPKGGESIVALPSEGRAGACVAALVDLAHGIPLNQMVAQAQSAADVSALPFADVCRLISQVASALAAMHERGLLHRDVTPRNILYNEKTKEALLVDYGGAKQRDGSWSPVTTEQYAAPEIRLYCPPAPHTPASDVYALGRVLLYCLGPNWQNVQERFPLLKGLSQRMVADNPDTRPSAAEVAQQLNSYSRRYAAPTGPN